MKGECKNSGSQSEELRRDSGTLKFSNPVSTVKEETKHTPGPWEVNHGPKTIDSDHRFVEIHSITGGKTGDGNVIAVVLADSFNHTVPFTYEAKANAELIASAPDLLKENQELKAELQTLAELSGNLMKAMEQRQFFFEGYANGSASISECNEAASNESKAYSNLWNFLKNEGL